MIEAFLQNCLVMLYSSPATLAFQVITLSLATTGTNTAYLFGFQVNDAFCLCCEWG